MTLRRADDLDMERRDLFGQPPPISWGTSWSKPALWVAVAMAMLAALAAPAPAAETTAGRSDAGAIGFLAEFEFEREGSEIEVEYEGRDGEFEIEVEGGSSEVEGIVLAPILEPTSSEPVSPQEAQGDTFFTGTGAGIDVALIDTGVSPVPGLHQPGKVLYGPDLSNEAELANLANLDTYGHGTHMAGIIVGDDGDRFRGVAPDARLVSIKVAGATGETHIAQVIAAIDWVVEHRNADGLNIRVLNLSLGQPGSGTTHVGDHLAAAVERAWDAGIVVVVAGGNRGNDSDGLDSPAISPWVIATAGLNGRSAADGIAPWSSSGDGSRDPDLAAPGSSIVSLRVPGSTLDTLHPEARVGEQFFRASGTSQAAATLTGTVARLLSTEPSLTPDQVKLSLMKTALNVKRGLRLDGRGTPQLEYAASLAQRIVPYPYSQSHVAAIPESKAIDTWSGGSWNGAVWSGGTWSGARWNATWSGAVWSATWSGAVWNTATWSATWSGATWSGAAWHGLETASTAVAEAIEDR